MSEDSKYGSPRRGFSGLSFIIGVVVGGGIASGILGYLLIEEQNRNAEALTQAALKVGLNGINAAGDVIDIGRKEIKKVSENESIVEIGKGFVDDLEKNRIVKLHRSMTEDYQKKMPQEMLTTYLATYKSLTQLDTTTYNREHHIRKLAKNRGYDFYFTGKDRYTMDILNVALTLVDVDGEWQIDDLVVTKPGGK